MYSKLKNKSDLKQFSQSSEGKDIWMTTIFFDKLDVENSVATTNVKQSVGVFRQRPCTQTYPRKDDAKLSATMSTFDSPAHHASIRRQYVFTVAISSEFVKSFTSSFRPARTVLSFASYGQLSSGPNWPTAGARSGLLSLKSLLSTASRYFIHSSVNAGDNCDVFCKNDLRSEVCQMS